MRLTFTQQSLVEAGLPSQLGHDQAPGWQRLYALKSQLRRPWAHRTIIVLCALTLGWIASLALCPNLPCAEEEAAREGPLADAVYLGGAHLPASPCGTAATALCSALDVLGRQAMRRNEERVNPAQEFAAWGLNLHYPDLEAYRTKMMLALDRYFDPVAARGSAERIKQSTRRQAVASQLSFGGSLATGANLDDDFPRMIFATSKVPAAKQDQDPDFGDWLGKNPGWDMTHLDDAGLSDWVQAQSSVRGQDGRVYLAGLRDAFESLEEGVLKSDVFRYLALFLHGGVYTDTDTAPVVPFSAFPGIGREDMGEHVGDPDLVMLDDAGAVRSLAGDAHAQSDSSGHMQALIAGLEALALGTSQEALDAQKRPPRLILAAEVPPRRLRADQPTDMARGLQITQWTMIAKPFHPVMLDALSTALDSQTARRRAGTPYDPDAVMDLTGPGLFSDCVATYLWARWGVTPDQIDGTLRATRVGDVLIYPSYAFRSGWPRPGGGGPYNLVFHGYMGRWKGRNNEVM